MWDKASSAVRAYDSLVLTSTDAMGYPYSVRCQPRVLDSEQLLEIEVPAHTGIQPGPASLMGHKHDQNLWSLSSFLLRGTLERQGERWLFRPTQFTPGAPESQLDMMGFLFATRKTAANYLKRRNLPRPSVNWQEIKALWQEADAVRQKSG